MSTKETELTNLTNEYLEYLKKENVNEATVHTFELVLKKIKTLGFSDEYIYNFSTKKIYSILLGLDIKNVNNFKAVCTPMSSFLKWCVEEKYITQEQYEEFYNTDKRKLFMENKKTDMSLVSYEEYMSIINDIELNDKNSLYLSTMLMCVYEGIYSGKLYELIKMRREHIDEYTNSIRLFHKDGTNTTLKISPKLADNLIKLSNMNTWTRENKSGDYDIETVGMYDDSIFKIELRGEKNEESFKHCLYRRLRMIGKEYINKKVTPLDIFKSGILYRVDFMAKKDGIELKNYFKDTRTKKEIKLLLEKELKRVYYDMPAITFMTKVKDDIELFK